MQLYVGDDLILQVICCPWNMFFFLCFFGGGRGGRVVLLF